MTVWWDGTWHVYIIKKNEIYGEISKNITDTLKQLNLFNDRL